jgi:hypothetical protein
LLEAEKLIETIRNKGARLAVPGVVDLSDIAASADGVASDRNAREVPIADFPCASPEPTFAPRLESDPFETFV